MVSRNHLLYLFVTLLGIVSSGLDVGNDISDAGKYLEHLPQNGSSRSPAPQLPEDFVNHREVREREGVDSSQEVNSSSSVPADLTTAPKVVCSTSLFTCRNGQCVSKHFLCDGTRDCTDGSDEDNCKQRTSRKCPPNRFHCDNTRCIPQLWQCDGQYDCKDHSDEKGCEATCPSNEYRCRSGLCVVASSVCDGEKDCEDGDDEDDCEKAHCLSVPGHYQCESGECVPPSQVCDKTKHCSDGSDEGMACATSCGSNNCTQVCYQTPKGPHCSCRLGFSLQKDLITCADENECEGRKVLVCDHFCKNTMGGFRCSCHDSYALQADNVTCKHKRSGGGFILVAQANGIRQLFLDGSQYTQIYSGNVTVVGLGYDPVTKKVFWSTHGNLLKASLKPDALPQKVLNNGIVVPEGLAVDWTARNLYLTDAAMHHILACRLDGSACYQVLRKLGHPRAIQLDMVKKYMYWTDVKRGSIQKAGMDGSDPTILVKDGLVWPNGMALDLPAGRLYWLDANTDEAHSIKLDGTGKKVLHLATVDHPFALALWEDRIYWTDWKQKEIVSCRKRDGKRVQTLLKGSHGKQYFGLVVYHPTMMDDIENPCSYARCSHLCILSPHSPGYTCACPTGVMQLDQDRLTCVDMPGRIHLIVNSFEKMYYFSPHVYGLGDQRAWMPDLNIRDIGDVEYFPGQDLVFVSDQYYGRIYSVDMKADTATILVNHTVARSMAVDWLRHNLYWLDSGYNVEVMRLSLNKTNYHTAVITALSAPLSIAVAPLLRLMFVSCGSSEPQTPPNIKRCGLDGRQCTFLVTTGIHTPISLTMDHRRNYLYWCDVYLGTVERINPNGTNRFPIMRGSGRINAKRVVSLVVTGDSVSWTVEFLGSVFTSSIDPLSSNVRITNMHINVKEREMLKLTQVNWEIPDEVRGRQRPCYNNGGCSEICVADEFHDEVCLCESPSQLLSDGKTCKKQVCAEHLFQCVDNSQCISANFKCDGSAECFDGSDEAGCPDLCPSNHYKCNTTDRCIHNSKLCDGHPDCDDGSDEKDPCASLSPSLCSDGHLCDTDKCFPKLFVCNGHVDCNDASDEENCNITCSPGKVKCRTGLCVPEQWVCDGDLDCHDGSDEENCPVTCSTNQFPCDNKCIEIHAICDGKEDCEDGKDELDWMCMTSAAQICPYGEVPCLSEGSKQDFVCFGLKDRCNGVVDCPLGDDESFHFCPVCHENEFQCPSTNSCMPLRFICDGEPDCVNGTDEGTAANCTTATTTTQTTVTLGIVNHCGDDFLCEDGTCLAYSMVCDGHRDCLDGSDEQQSCEVRCDVMKCQHKCRASPERAYCSCDLGYHLAADGRTCLDDQECKDERLCSHRCTERPGSFQCACLPGYQLANLTTCKREVGEDYLVVVMEEGIFNFTHMYELQGVFHTPSSVTLTSFVVDPILGRFLYSDASRQVVGELTKFRDGEMKETVLFRGRSNPGPVCYDPRRRNIYVVEMFGDIREQRDRSIRGTWNTDKNEDKGTAEGLWSSIMACNLDGRGCGVVFGSNDSVVMSMAAAASEKRLLFCTKFWSMERGQIMTSYLDGTEMHEIRKKVVWCSTIAVDDAKRRVYWIDLALGTLETVKWEGEGHHVVHRQQAVWFPVGLTLVGPNVVWVNRRSRLLLLCPKLPNGGKCNNLTLPVLPHALFAAPLPLESEQKPCDNSTCSHLCASGGTGCLCRAGYHRSSNDAAKCEKLNSCDNHRCHGGSTCEAHTADRYVCRCPEGMYGSRCEFEVVTSQQSATATTATVVVVVLLLLLAVVVLGFLYWWKRCPLIWKTRGHGDDDQGYHFVNPAFGVIRDQPLIEDEDSPATISKPYPCSPHYPPPYAPLPGDRSLRRNADSPPIQHKEGQISSNNDTSGDSAVASTTDSFLAAQHTDVNLVSPINRHMNLEDGKDILEFNYSPFNPSKV